MAENDAAKKLAQRLFVERIDVVMDRLESTSPEYGKESKKHAELYDLLRGVLDAEGCRALLNLADSYCVLGVRESKAFYLQGLIDGMELADLMAKGEYHVKQGDILAQAGQPLINLLGEFTLEDMEDESHRIARVKEEIREILPGAQFTDDEEDAPTD